MAEDYLEEIYRDARLISGMREVVCWTQVYDEYHAREKYTELLPELIRACREYARSDSAGGESLLNCLQEIYDISHDSILLGDIIERKLQPLLEKSCLLYTSPSPRDRQL